MKLRNVVVVLVLGATACASIPEPETPDEREEPSRQTPRRPPLPPAPSKMPEIVYASVTIDAPLARPALIAKQ